MSLLYRTFVLKPPLTFLLKLVHIIDCIQPKKRIVRISVGSRALWAAVEARLQASQLYFLALTCAVNFLNATSASISISGPLIELAVNDFPSRYWWYGGAVIMMIYSGRDCVSQAACHSLIYPGYWSNNFSTVHALPFNLANPTVYLLRQVYGVGAIASPRLFAQSS